RASPAWLRPSCVSNGDHKSTFGPTKDSPLIPQKTDIKPQMFGVRLSFQYATSKRNIERFA
ncbi:MAG TPA: hypothetical protein VN831_03885, partial [Bradyrhizobium sp.]|nr:hypothetical protein [Bradyrhizobium sp.]